VATVFIFDTSPSMELAVGAQTRLDDAKGRAREVLNKTAAGSRVAVLDSAEDPGGDDRAREWLSVAQARTRIDNLRVRAGNWPLNRQIEHAFDLLAELGNSTDAPPRVLYVFSDRTAASWDAKATKRIARPDAVAVVYVDVGVDNPRDVSIEDLEINPPVVAPGETVHVRATVKATGDVTGETELQCQFEGEPNPDRQVIAWKDGAQQDKTFDKVAPPLAAGDAQSVYQVTVRLAANDALPANNARYATFAVRSRRKVLTLIPDKLARRDQSAVAPWAAALKYAPGMFEADVRTVTEEEAGKLTAKEMQPYKVVCLFELESLPQPLWGQLSAYVKSGGGLVVVPPPTDAKEKRDAFNKDGSAVLPATLDRLIRLPARDAKGELVPGTPWAGYPAGHPITAALDKMCKTGEPDFKYDPPTANGYWVVLTADGTTVLAKYADAEQHPALVERTVERGRVIQFTVPLDDTMMEGNRRWHNYWYNSFGLILVDLTCRYLAGEGTGVELNYLCRQRFTLPLPPGAGPFRLFGPGVSETESTLAAAADPAALDVPATLEPGNFFIRGKADRTAAAFSMNIRREEFDLTRVPVQEIEAVLGDDSVLPAGSAGGFGELLDKVLPQKRQLWPYVMLFLLLMLPVESVLANLFTRRQSGEPQ
jgi:hypothetical protein